MTGTANRIWILTSAVASAIATLLACIGQVWIAIGIVAVVAAFIALGFAHVRATVIAAAGLISIMSASSVFLPDDDSTVSIVLRVIGSLLLVLAGLQARHQGHSASPELKSTIRRWTLILGPLVALYIAFVTIPQAMWSSLVAYEFGTLLLCLVVLSSGPQIASGTLQKAVVVALGTIVAGSIAAGILLPDYGIEQGRLRGLLNNANLLGFYAFLLALAALLLVNRLSTRVALLGVSAIALLWTASRSSVLALAVAVVILILLTRFATGVMVVGGLVLLGLIVGLIWPSFVDVFSGITRGNDSRSASLDVAVQALNIDPWHGVGLGNEASIIASSPLRAAADGGYFGLAALIALWVGIIVLSARVGGRTLALGTAAVVHSCFEGWLLSPVGPMIMVFALLWVCIAATDLARRRETSTVDPNVSAGLVDQP